MRNVLFVLAVLVLINSPVAKFAGAQTKKAADVGVIEIGEGKDGKFRFFVRDDEGKLLAMSSPGGFASVKDAEAAIADLKAIVGKAKVSVLKKEATKDKEPVKDKKAPAKDAK